VVNSPLFDQPELVKDLASAFGQQCVVGSVDLKRQTDGTYQIHTQSGRQPLAQPPQTALQWLSQDWVGELYLNSIDRDGTGQGYDFDLLDQLPVDCSVPVILAGGVGNGQQLAVGFADPRVDAVATAHLFNFVGDGLQRARQTLMDQGANLPVWPTLEQLGLGNAPRQTGA
jgi:cyclase